MVEKELSRYKYTSMFGIDDKGLPLKHSRGLSYPLHIFSLEANIESVKKYISMGVDINCRDKQGKTPLHEACCSNRSTVPGERKKEIIELLINSGADKLAIDNLGETVLHCVARHNHNREIASYFVIVCKVPLTCLNRYGQTALDVAKESCSFGHRQYLSEPITPKNPPFSFLPEVLQFLLLEENRSHMSLRELARDAIRFCLSPYEDKKLDQLPLPTHLKCYVGGTSYIEWTKQKETGFKLMESNIMGHLHSFESQKLRSALFCEHLLAILTHNICAKWF